MSGRRLQSLQILRGIAAMLVVLVHAINVTDNLEPRWGRAAIGHALKLNEFGACGVDLFFVLSGFVMAMTMGRFDGAAGALEFLRRRWLRVAPPFWIACAAFMVVSVAVGLPCDGRGLATIVPLLPLNGGAHYLAPPLLVGWTLGFELFFYLLVGIAIAALPRDRRPVAALAALVACAAIGVRLEDDGIVANPLLLEFGLGIVGWACWRRGLGTRTAWGLIALGLAALAATLVVGWPFETRHAFAVAGIGGGWRVLLWGVPWTMVLLGAAALPLRGGRAARLGIALGDASYSIYLVHMIVLTAAEAAFRATGPFLPPSLIVPPLVALCGYAGWLVHRRYERRYMRWCEPRPEAVPASVAVVAS